jgi:hypothetical protein
MKTNIFFLLGSVGIIAQVLRVIMDPIRAHEWSRFGLLLLVIALCSMLIWYLGKQIWSDMKKFSITKVLLENYKKDKVVWKFIFVVLILLSTGESTIDALLNLNATLPAFIFYALDANCIFLAICYWPSVKKRLEEMPETK